MDARPQPSSEYKLLQRYEIPGHARSLTFSTYNRSKLLHEPWIAQCVLSAIAEACVQQPWSVLAFVIMPDHVHLLVVPTTPTPDMPRLLYAIKRPSSFKIKAMLDVQQRAAFTTPAGAFRLWQAGAGYDRNLWTRDSINNTIEYIHANPVRAELCSKPGDWPWSSWHQWMNTRYQCEPYEPEVDRHSL